MALSASLDCTSASVSSCRHLRDAAHLIRFLAVSSRHSHSHSQRRLSRRCSRRRARIIYSVLALPECQESGSTLPCSTACRQLIN